MHLDTLSQCLLLFSFTFWVMNCFTQPDFCLIGNWRRTCSTLCELWTGNFLFFQSLDCFSGLGWAKINLILTQQLEINLSTVNLIWKYCVWVDRINFWTEFRPKYLTYLIFGLGFGEPTHQSEIDLIWLTRKRSVLIHILKFELKYAFDCQSSWVGFGLVVFVSCRF